MVSKSLLASATAWFSLCLAGLVGAEPPAKPLNESHFYPIHQMEVPKDAVLEVSALEWLPEGRLAVASRRGEIWIITDPTGEKPQWQRFAHGLHEVLGLAWKDGWLYVTQRPEVSRIRDTNGDGEADDFETVADGWGMTGDYHEYAFGSKFDREGKKLFIERMIECVNKVRIRPTSWRYIRNPFPRGRIREIWFECACWVAVWLDFRPLSSLVNLALNRNMQRL